MQSQLLSGGIPFHLFALFDSSRLQEMLNDASLGIGNVDIVEQIQKAQAAKAGKNLKEIMNEDEKILHEIIHSECNRFVDMACQALQLALKRRGGLVAGYSHTGGIEGTQLTRAAFAIMIKFGGLSHAFKELVELIDASEEFMIPKEDGKEKNEALLNIAEEFAFLDQILACWANATKMRRWLMMLKQRISSKFEYSDD